MLFFNLFFTYLPIKGIIRPLQEMKHFYDQQDWYNFPNFLVHRIQLSQVGMLATNIKKYIYIIYLLLF